jgi:diadenosine tetraphosphate (Ap4A) HIT family hydrolase
MCQSDWPDEDRNGLRVNSGRFSEAYLQRADVQRGYVVVIWRGRHVAEPTDLSLDERVGYWCDIVEVGAAVERLYRPKKMNYMMLGNQLPHLHTHVIPRYEHDAAPGAPFPFPAERQPDLPESEIRADAMRLRELVVRDAHSQSRVRERLR